MPKIVLRMRVTKYVYALWVGVLVYAVLNIVVGKTGLEAYDALTLEKERQVANLTNLENLNIQLAGTRDALKYDSDTLTVYARELGFGTKDERFIRIAGTDAARNRHNTAGEVLGKYPIDAVDDKVLRIAALCVAGAFLVFFAFIDIIKMLSARLVQ